MFKSIFTTRMSDDGKTLKRRFEKINSKISLKAKVLALVLTLLIAVFVAGVILVLSRTEFTLGNSDSYKITVHDENPDIEYDELYEVIFRKDNGEVLYTKTFDYRYAIEEIGEGVYNVRSWGGTNSSYDVFVDTKNDRVSEEYFNLLCYDGETVVYCENNAIIIDHMFGTAKICIARIERDFANTAHLSSAITYAELNKDKLTLRYLKGENFEEVYEEIDIFKDLKDSLANIAEKKVTQTGVTILCDGNNVNLRNKPFYYNGDIYVPLKELFEQSIIMEKVTHFIIYDGDEIRFTTNEDGELNKYRMEVDKNYIDGDNEFIPVTKPVNAPMRYNNVVYIPMEYVYSMYFYDVVIDYRLTGDSPFIEKINDAIEFQEEAKHWTPEGYTQQDLNNKAYEVFENWRLLLNEIMAELSDDELTEIDNISWSKSCDKYMENEASPYEGGSMQPMIKYYAGSHFTRKRCEQLIVEYLS